MMDQNFVNQLISQMNNATRKEINALKSFQIPKCIQLLTADCPIILFDEIKDVYASDNCDNPNYDKLRSPNFFHQIIVHHGGSFTKEQVLEGFFEVVDDELFIPIAYRRDTNIDYFFVAKQFEAMRKIFEKRLLIPVNGMSLQILVKACAAECRVEHKFYTKIPNVIEKCINIVSVTLGALNLDNFAKDPDLREMSISLGNNGTLDLFLNKLNEQTRLKGKNSAFRIFKFANNGIKSLLPFQHLHNFQMEIIDLSYNKIEDIRQLEHLKFLNVQELHIKGNKCCDSPENIEKVREILPGLRKLDNMLIASVTLYKTNIRGEPTRVGNQKIPTKSMRDGTPITQKNRTQILKTIFSLRNDNCWSKVIVHHDDLYKQEQILRNLARGVCYNASFFPCYSKRFKGRDEFFLYKNFEAIKILVQAGLKVTMDHGVNGTYNCHVKLNVADFEEDQVDWSENLKFVISQRIKHNKLNLNEFQKEEILSNIYVCLENHSNFNFILDQVRLANRDLTEMHLENCGISSSDALVMLSAFQKLKLLNLRSNMIEKLDGIRKIYSVTEMFLDDNPICNCAPLEYIAVVHSHFPKLEWLDGHRVQQGNSLIIFQNYLVTIDVYTVVDEFIKHYFTLWDSFERPLLKNMYKSNSIVTLCCNYEYHKEKEVLPFNEIYPLVQKYVSFDRNLKKISDLSKAINKVYIGEHDINRLFNDLPGSRHDLVNCNIDVPYFDAKNSKIVLIISGIMEDLTNEERPLTIAFTRTFTIKGESSEFFITNDQILLRNPTDNQREVSNCHTLSAKYEDLQEYCRDLLPTELEQKTLKIVMLQEFTQCKKEFCQKLLEDKFWDLKVALACFNVDMNEDKIPNEAFNFK